MDEIEEFRTKFDEDLNQFKKYADEAWNMMMETNEEVSNSLKYYETIIPVRRSESCPINRFDGIIAGGGEISKFAQCQLVSEKPSCLGPPGPPGEPGLPGEDGKPGQPGLTGSPTHVSFETFGKKCITCPASPPDTSKPDRSSETEGMPEFNHKGSVSPCGSLAAARQARRDDSTKRNAIREMLGTKKEAGDALTNKTLKGLVQTKPSEVLSSNAPYCPYVQRDSELHGVEEMSYPIH